MPQTPNTSDPNSIGKVLLTGSSGFIGEHIYRRLEAAGIEVTGIGRRPTNQSRYLSHDLSRPLPESFIKSFGPWDVIIHASARSSPWGTRKQYLQDNVEATKFLLEMAKQIGAPKFVYISSSSVYYRPEDQWDIREDTPLPKQGVNLYAETKRQGEELVQMYCGSWAILRPRAVFGPGDTVLFPRILAAARAGKLPLLTTDGKSAVGDLIYIDNLVDQIVQTVVRPEVVGVFNLTNDEPIAINDFLIQVLQELGLPQPTRRVSARVAMLGAGILELVHRCFLPNTEPVITRFGVHVFRYSKTFDISKAKSVFGPPRVSLDDARKRTVEYFAERIGMENTNSCVDRKLVSR